ncbi:flagellar export protein FliJ [Geosporobacter ferrireducens]|uniref:Flagellar FliJ protein n=1 Tax=Geosporobacter ferrireducens TaxID=1424294 RepID=A0A1D8GBJ9_9FIRM|nr:flagellar export protein FliJ [Geosporobacter ferrireducens]AOT68280.1 flagellar export protein FliJ [Geosporobacter ferrireducens]MTI57297.1 flagellar export protein FliJ [Geosporobacter ferrireducens]
MNKFHFKYDNLLNVKEKHEEIAKGKLHKAVEKLDLEKDILNGFNKDRRNCQQQLRSQMEEGVHAARLKVYESYMHNLNQKIQHQQESIEQCNNNINHLRMALVKATTEKRTFEKLKEKEKQLFNYQEKKEEEKFIDQLVTFNNFKSN